MTQVSKYFRRLLLDKKASGVWKMAFQRHEEIPACPPGTAYPQWTFLLFGPGICTVRCVRFLRAFFPQIIQFSQKDCGRHGALADFALRQRYCSRCMVCMVFINFKENMSAYDILRNKDKRSQLLPTFIDNRGKPLTKGHLVYSMVSCSYRISKSPE